MIVFSIAASMYNDNGGINNDDLAPCAYGAVDNLSYGPAFGLFVAAWLLLLLSLAMDIYSMRQGGAAFDA